MYVLDLQYIASCLDAESGAFSCRVDEFLKPQSCLYFNGHKLATNKKGKNPAYFHCVVPLTSHHIVDWRQQR